MKKNERMNLLMVTILADSFYLIYTLLMVGINDKCIGCGTCALIAPELFKVEGVPAQLIKAPAPEDKDTYNQAKDACPVDAIESF